MCHSSPHMLICGGLEGRLRGMERSGGGCTVWEECDSMRGEAGWSAALWIAIACFNFLVGLSALVYPAANDQVLHLQTKLPPLHPHQPPPTPASFKTPQSSVLQPPTVAQVLRTTCQRAIRCRWGWVSDGMRVFKSLTWATACRVGGWQPRVFETVPCLQICADLISLWRQRLEDDLAAVEKTVDKVFDHGWYALRSYWYLWSCVPSKEASSEDQLLSEGSRVCVGFEHHRYYALQGTLSLKRKQGGHLNRSWVRTLKWDWDRSDASCPRKTWYGEGTSV